MWNFARDNILTMSCAIALQQHAENVDLVKLSQNNASTCFLECPKKIMVNNENFVAEGVCLFYDRVRTEWIRCGNELEGRCKKNRGAREECRVKTAQFFLSVAPAWNNRVQG